MLYQFYIPVIKSTWSWCIILLKYCWIWFTNGCSWIFTSMSMQILIFTFLYIWFLYQNICYLIKWVEKYSPVNSLGNISVRIGFIHFLHTWQNLPSKPSGSEDFFLGKLVCNYRFYPVKDAVLFRLLTYVLYVINCIAIFTSPYFPLNLWDL